MNISVVHTSFAVDGGGERVTLSLLRALDRTCHRVELRCVVPPAGVSFGGMTAPQRRLTRTPRLRRRGDRAEGAACAEHGPQSEGRFDPAHDLKRTRLTVVAEGKDSVRSLFNSAGCDLLVVTDGGFILDKTDAPRALLYANSDLSYNLQSLSRRPPSSSLRRPWRMARRLLAQAAFRRSMAMIRDGMFTVVPNTVNTAGSYARLAGRYSLEKVVYPPVSLERFNALRKVPKEPRVATVGRFAPEKNYERAIRVLLNVRAEWDAVGNAGMPPDPYMDKLRGLSRPGMHFHADASESELDMVLGRAKVYLHARPESFGIAVVEAVAAGCVPIVPDDSAHPETVPFRELRYKTEDEAAAKVKRALAGGYDHMLPALHRHAQRFSEGSFQDEMLSVIERRNGCAASRARADARS